MGVEISGKSIKVQVRINTHAGIFLFKRLMPGSFHLSFFVFRHNDEKRKNSAVLSLPENDS